MIRRKSIQKYHMIVTADPADRRVLARLAGLKEDAPMDKVAMAVLDGAKGATRAIKDTLAISDLRDDAVKALVATIGLGRPRLRAIWNLLDALDHVNTQLPQSDVRAGSKVMEQATALTEGDREELARILELAKS